MLATLPLRRVLWPTDFSECSRHALSHAIALALRDQARLTALHVAPPPIVAGTEIVPAEAPLDPALRAEWLGQLDLWVAPAREAGLAVDTLLVEDDPVHGILDQVRALPADLVVLGSHGRSGLERFLLGSVAETVLRRSPCPVFTVSPQGRPASAAPFRRILCPLDLSTEARATLNFALILARHHRARLDLLHVVEGPVGGALRPETHYDVPEFRSYLHTDALAWLRRAVPPEVRHELSVAEVVVTGRAPDEVLRVASERGADLIMMGAHGRNPIDVLFFGSTARDVVRRASCPVITLRSEPPPKAHAADLSLSA